MEIVVQSLVTGVLFGGLYALIGVGMSLIFGIMKITNIAHGDLMIMSTFLTMTFATSITGGNMFLAIVITCVVMAIVGILIQKFLVNKVIDKGSEPALLVTFGLSIAIQNALLLFYGPNSQSLSSELLNKNLVNTPWAIIPAQYAKNLVVAIVIIIILTIVMKYTSFGRAIRATSGDRMAAELMGVNTKRIFVLAMCMTMVATAIAGLLVGETFVFYPSTGTQYLIIAFGVVVIGGMGSIPGTLIGGIILGVSQMLGATFFGPTYQTLTGYIVMLVILTIKPQGLLSKKARL
ncbi:MAG: branched-chain amino acid ABC transporter permease [Clostridiales bacterium]|nr:branched-chain amino acid ABC transporter permease [Clostridiales bacterium]